MQPDVLEAPCASCHQNVPLDHESCPYCHTPVKSYWFSDANRLKRAVPVIEPDKSYVLVDGKKLAADSPDFPAALRSFFPSPTGNANARKPWWRFSLGDFIGLPSPAKPSQWDSWLDSTQETPGDSIDGNDMQNRSFIAREFYKQLAAFPSPWNQPHQQLPSKQRALFWIFFVVIILLDHWKH